MKYLIILAGYPATGKSYIAEKLLEYFENSKFLSPDEIQERMFYEYGFKNAEEKRSIYNNAFLEFYETLDSYMKCLYTIIIDYPFSYLQKEKLESLVNINKYRAITIRLIGDLEKIYKRRIKRDLDDSRCAGHMLEIFNKNMKVNKDMRLKKLISFEEFKAHCELRKYDEFQIGELIEKDVGDNFVNSDEIIQEIIRRLN